jgi:excinuclease ABC subunit C
MSIKVLEGKTSEVVERLVSQMESASVSLDFERAARLRDQIKDLKAVNQTQYVENEKGDIDVVACYQNGGSSCVQVFFIRNGVNLGNKAFYPATPEGASVEEVLTGFVQQFYLQHEVPRRLITHTAIQEHDLTQQALSMRAGHNVDIVSAVRGDQRRWVDNALENAKIALESRLASRSGMAERQEQFRRLLQLDDLPKRMECFDISHLSGEATIASCVVFGVEGAVKAEYRRFQIKDITAGDDYAAMRQALTRRYTRLLKENQRIPEVLLIDGGKGQVAVAQQVMEELQLEEVAIVGVSKGPERRPGEETLLLVRSGQEIQMRHDSPALHSKSGMRRIVTRCPDTVQRGVRIAASRCWKKSPVWGRNAASCC